MTYKLIVQNTKLILKTVAGATLNFIGIKDSNTGTGVVTNNLIDWKLLNYCDTSTNLTSANPVLGLGQHAFTSDVFYGATDQMQFKVGDGVQTWSNLDYMPVGSGGGGGSQTLAQVLVLGKTTGGQAITSNNSNSINDIQDTYNSVSIDNGTDVGQLYMDAVSTNLSHTQKVAITAPLIEVSQDPTTSLGVATKQYTDTQINGVITSSLSFFYYKTISDIGTYYKMLQAPSVGGAQSIMKPNTTGTTSIAKFITEPSAPNKLYIPIGWNRIHIHAEKTGAGNVTLLAKIFKRDLGGTETVLFTTAPTLTNLTTSVTPYDLEFYNTLVIPQLGTDRYGVEILSVTATGTPDVTIWIEDAFLSRVDLPSASNDLSGYELTVNKDATGGYAGLTLFKINFKNALNTFTSFFTNSNTASRTYTFQNRNGTIADDTDLATKQATLVSLTNIKTVNGLTLLGSTNLQVGAPSTLDTLVFSGSYMPAKLAYNTFSQGVGFGPYLIAQKIDNRKTCIITSLSVYCSTASAGTNVRLSLYTDLNGYPNTLISGTDTGDLSTATTGLKEGAITATTLTEGTIYHIVVQMSSSVTGFRYNLAVNQDYYSSGGYYGAIYYNTAYAAAPATFPVSGVYAATNAAWNVLILLKQQ